jgi:glycerophosphoryl diester phosphodiesterase
MSLYYFHQVKWADGKKFEDKFVDTLLKYGYKGEYMSENWMKQPLFIQSFAPTSIVHVSDLIDSPKVFLIDDIIVRTQDTNQVLMFSNNLSPICSLDNRNQPLRF